MVTIGWWNLNICSSNHEIGEIKLNGYKLKFTMFWIRSFSLNIIVSKKPRQAWKWLPTGTLNTAKINRGQLWRLGRPYHFKLFKGCLPQILLDSLMNTLTHLQNTFKDNFIFCEMFYSAYVSKVLSNRLFSYIQFWRDLMRLDLAEMWDITI